MVTPKKTKEKSTSTEKSTVKKKVHEKIDPYGIILAPLSTEKSIRKIEFGNTLSFVVSPQASKKEVHQAVEELFKVKVVSVNTVNTQMGEKRAYVKLAPSSVAADVSADLGLI